MIQGMDGDASSPGGAKSASDAIREAIESQAFESLEDVQAFVYEFTNRRNRTPTDDFCGLTPEEMTRVLYFPFESPDFASFPAVLNTQPSAPITTLFELLVAAIGEKGVKPTAKGNLPLNVVREMALAYWGEEIYAEQTRYGSIRTESHCLVMHVTRLTAQLAGLIRKYDGKIVVTKACRSMMDKQGLAGVYPRLLRASVQKYNWGYSDHFPGLSIIQASFLFTLYLLHRFGDTWRDDSFYAAAFVRAFPMALDEVEPSPYYTTEDFVRRCYVARSLERFADYFGLIETQSKPGNPLDRGFNLRKRSLLEEAVVFRV